MAPIFVAALQVIGFLVENKETIKQLIINGESLVPDAPGASKAGTIKNFIGIALGIEAQIESVWPLVAPFFNLFVASVKSTLHPAQ